jgi:hypothetical protein
MCVCFWEGGGGSHFLADNNNVCVCLGEGAALSKPNFMKFHEVMNFHEIFPELSWKIHDFTELFSPGVFAFARVCVCMYELCFLLI